MPWTQRSLHPSLKLITIAAWWWFYHIPLSKKEMLDILKAFSPSTVTFWALKKKKNQTPLSFKCEADTYWFVNTKHQIAVFNFYLFIFLLHQKMVMSWLLWPPQFKMYMNSCYLRCSKIHEASASVTLHREINGFQWKRILVLF